MLGGTHVTRDPIVYQSSVVLLCVIPVMVVCVIPVKCACVCDSCEVVVCHCCVCVVCVVLVPPTPPRPNQGSQLETHAALNGSCTQISQHMPKRSYMFSVFSVVRYSSVRYSAV